MRLIYAGLTVAMLVATAVVPNAPTILGVRWG